MNTLRKLTAISLIWLAGLATIAADATFNSVTLGWTANTEADLAGYRLYFTKNPDELTHVKPVELVTQTTVELPSPGTWYFVLTAKNQAGLESLPSEMVIYATPTGPAKPGTLRVASAVATQVSTVTTSTNLILVP